MNMTSAQSPMILFLVIGLSFFEAVYNLGRLISGAEPVTFPNGPDDDEDDPDNEVDVWVTALYPPPSITSFKKGSGFGTVDHPFQSVSVLGKTPEFEVDVESDVLASVQTDSSACAEGDRTPFIDHCFKHEPSLTTLLAPE
jgi:hypothetical protein